MYHRIIGQYLDCLCPCRMDSLVFSCRYREEFGQLHLKDGGDVRIFGDDTVRFDGEKRELAFQCGGL